MIVIVFGLPGTGKSFFASRLAERIKAEYLSTDQIRFKMIKSRTYGNEEKMKVYHEMLTLTKSFASKNRHVVLDGTFYQEKIRQMFISMASFLKVRMFFIEVIAQDLLVKERVNNKRRDSEADYSVYLKIKGLFEPMGEKHLTIESKRDNIEDMLQQATEALD